MLNFFSYTTVYGHCSEVLTAPGKTVKKGQIIARSGSTGRATGPHLHFEIRRNGVPQDPMKFLW
jgi:murein DD-endopeptidase MepM/ murein hydrolase activator NlpD